MLKIGLMLGFILRTLKRVQIFQWAMLSYGGNPSLAWQCERD